MVAYPLLRVEIQEVEIERVSGFPPRLLRPASIEPFDLDINGHLCPSRTAKATHLAKLAHPEPEFGSYTLLVKDELIREMLSFS